VWAVLKPLCGNDLRKDFVDAAAIRLPGFVQNVGETTNLRSYVADGRDPENNDRVDFAAKELR
jgi:hypothetical protein